MIKARPVAGDRAAGAQFLRQLHALHLAQAPRFRRDPGHPLDQAPDQRASRRRQTSRVAGHNVKLGRGGIREIEFFAQTQQLILGGRDPSLRAARAPATRSRALAARRPRSPTRPPSELIDAYRFLRRVEHRLQMIDDQQTQPLPEDAGGARPRSRSSSAIADARRLRRRPARATSRRVERPLCRAVRGGAEPVAGRATSSSPAPTTIPRRSRPWRDWASPTAQRVAATVRGWHHGRYRAMRSARARELLTELMPALLRRAGDERRSPTSAFARFDEFLARLPAGVQLFSLLHANPRAARPPGRDHGQRAAPGRASRARSPACSTRCSAPASSSRAAGPRRARGRAATARSGRPTTSRTCSTSARRWAKDRQFQVGVQLLRGITDAERRRRGPRRHRRRRRSRALLPAVEAEFARHHGRLPGGGMAIVALGQARQPRADRRPPISTSSSLYDAPRATRDASDGRAAAGAEPLLRAARASA